MNQRIRTMKPARPVTPAVARPSPSRRGYGREWRRVRAAKLADSPFCEGCRGLGLEVPATQVDHVRALAAGGTHDAGNLRSLCQSCHSRKTVAVDGGLGRARS